MKWYRVVLPYAVFGVAVKRTHSRNVIPMVCDAAPIGRWMIGYSIGFVRAWAEGRGGTVEGL